MSEKQYSQSFFTPYFTQYSNQNIRTSKLLWTVGCFSIRSVILTEGFLIKTIMQEQSCCGI